MSEKFIKNYFIFIFSLIPISIIIGSAISAINIVIIILSFLIYIFYEKNWKWIYRIEIKLILAICIYLIFNSLISQDISIGLIRNLGFVRFLILFVAFNFFFWKFKDFNKFLYVWMTCLIVVSLDVYYESYFGQNILGYGGDWFAGGRKVSFFKDEPIVGSFINSFYLVILGFVLHKKTDEKFNIKILGILISLLFIAAILLSGERSNLIKAFIGTFFFFTFCKNYSFNQKIYSFLILIVLLFTMITSSEYLRGRFYTNFIDNFTSKENINNFIKKNVYSRIYNSGYEVFKDNPIIGVGNKNFRVIACQKDNIKINPKYFCNSHPHQVYLEFLSEHGIIGSGILFIIFFSLFFKNINKIIQSRNSIQIGSLIYLVLVFTPLIPSGSFFNSYSLTIFWINLSILYASDKSTNIFSS
tara:strand:- start:290 stop:1534 length:1245 start_codon:yes stop_codon:yes gene_type:complete